MTIHAHIQAEPIPGYRLLERIGGGGFGEVWKAEAPGGLLKAIKFVHGSLHGNQSEEGLAHQELKALGRVKTVRHPYILSLERYDIINGQLLIVMELADRNLWDRFKECETDGLPGIPRDELLRYLAEAAEALDLMNIDYQLQHLDIKPQNLFLLHHHLKVADFGLVKDLAGRNTHVSGGVTPVYAAPETFEGIVSRYCDQYSLAIVYQELLTGQRPFHGSNVRRLLVQHTSEPPNLSSLPEGDRAAIARALNKKPEDRFPTCADLVRALRQGTGTVAATGARHAEPIAVETPAVVRLSPTHYSERPAPPPPGMGIDALSAAAAERSASPAPEEITGDGVLFPALVVGLGGLGAQVLRQLRANLNDRCGPADFLPQLRLLAIDTDPEPTCQATEGAAEGGLEERELVLARLNKPTHYLKVVRNRAILDTWLNLAMVCRLPRNQVTTEGLRILGRLGLVDNYRRVASRLRAELEACVNPKALRSADRQTQLGIRSSRPRVYLVAGLGGGTGSGMFIDAAYIVRAQLRRLGYAEADVVGLFFLPPADPAAKKSPALANAFAALTELHHYSSPATAYRAFFDDSEEPLHDAGAPFGRCIMLPFPREDRDPTAARHAVALAGDFLCRELISPLARKAEEARAAQGKAPELACQTFGAQRFAMPRQALRDQTANLLGLRLLQGWVSPNRGDLPQSVAARLADPSTGVDLAPDAMIGRLKSSGERGWQRPPETQFQAVLQRCFGQTGEARAVTVLGALGELEALVGQPAEGSAPSVLSDALAQAAQVMRREQGQRLADLLAALVEEPRSRLGGAEEAYRQLTTAIREAGQAQRMLYRELLAKAADAHTHIHALVCNLQKGSWWPGRKAKTAVELRQTLEDYPKWRYRALLLEHLLAIYRGLLEDLPAKQKELTFAGERLAQLQRLLRDELPASGQAYLGPGRHFFPAACKTFDQAIDALLRSIKPQALLEIDQKVQGAIRRQFRSLLQVCLGPATALKDLWAVVEQHARDAAAEQTGKASVAAIYLQGQPDETVVGGELAAAFEEAAPKLAGPRPIAPEIRLLVVPADLAGERLGQLAKAAVSGLEVLPVAGNDDVFFYREQSHLPLADLPQLGLLAEEAYRQMTSSGYFTPHNRMDVPNWLPVD